MWQIAPFRLPVLHPLIGAPERRARPPIIILSKRVRGFTDRSALLLCPADRVRQGDHGRDVAVIGGYDAIKIGVHP